MELYNLTILDQSFLILATQSCIPLPILCPGWAAGLVSHTFIFIVIITLPGPFPFPILLFA